MSLGLGFDSSLNPSLRLPILKRYGYDPADPSSLTRLSKTAKPRPSMKRAADPARDGTRKRKATANPTSGRRLDIKEVEAADVSGW